MENGNIRGKANIGRGINNLLILRKFFLPPEWITFPISDDIFIARAKNSCLEPDSLKTYFSSVHISSRVTRKSSDKLSRVLSDPISRGTFAKYIWKIDFSEISLLVEDKYSTLCKIFSIQNFFYSDFNYALLSNIRPFMGNHNVRVDARGMFYFSDSIDFHLHTRATGVGGCEISCNSRRKSQCARIKRAAFGEKLLAWARARASPGSPWKMHPDCIMPRARGVV